MVQSTFAGEQIDFLVSSKSVCIADWCRGTCSVVLWLSPMKALTAFFIRLCWCCGEAI